MQTPSVANSTKSSDVKGGKVICPCHRGEDRNRTVPEEVEESGSLKRQRRELVGNVLE